MKLASQSDEEKLKLCAFYFKGGFAFLPFLWAVNAIWFFNEAFRRQAYAEQKQIQKYVVLSAIGSTLWLGLFIAWIVTFQTHRVEWGETGDRLSLVIPTGIA